MNFYFFFIIFILRFWSIIRFEFVSWSLEHQEENLNGEIKKSIKMPFSAIQKTDREHVNQPIERKYLHVEFPWQRFQFESDSTAMDGVDFIYLEFVRSVNWDIMEATVCGLLTAYLHTLQYIEPINRMESAFFADKIHPKTLDTDS